jgi:hypothetical protein
VFRLALLPAVSAVMRPGCPVCTQRREGGINDVYAGAIDIEVTLIP